MTIELLEIDRESSAFQLMKPILDSVCNRLLVTEAELIGRQRNYRFVEARQIADWLGRRHTNLTLQMIGNVVGNRDHTTVLHGVRNIDRRIESDDWLRKVAAALDAEIKTKLATTNACVSV